MKLPAGAGGDPGETAPTGTARPVDRQLLDEIFGDVLPDTTDDERGSAESPDDEWYLSNRPPHHDR